MRKESVKKGKSKAGKIISIIEYVVIFLIIFVNIILVYKTIHNPNKTPDLFGKKAFIIISGSMIPTINIGDIVLINNSTDVHKDNIIAFREDGVVIVHRIIDEVVSNEGIVYQTKGDNNNAADINLVEVSNIEGVYKGKIPYVGKVVLYLYNNLWIVAILIIVFILFRYVMSGKCEEEEK